MSSVSSFLLGIAVGSAAALLFAPVSGKRLRTLMGDRVDEGRQAVEDRVRQGWDKAAEVVKEAKSTIHSEAKHLAQEVSLKP